ncbi:hypothetical protein [Vreelandella neptunia]|uniref:hypothetical protein n=1 Tax=Vreelandella neptunia TaxID=115551 RepID=UPI00315A0A87
MQDQLINQVINFMRESNLELCYPDIVPTKINEEGNQHHSHSFSIRMSENKIRGNEFLVRLLLFSALDALIDIKNPHLEGESFRQRYLGLPNSTEREIVLREVYRITKNIRNTMVHNLGKISIVDAGYQINYKKGKTIHSMTYGRKAITLLNTITIILIRNQNADDLYINNYITSYYQDLKSHILSFSDDISSPLATIHPKVKIKTRRRYRVEVPENCWDSETETYHIRRASLADEETGSASDEFMIKHEDGISLIPGEVINGNSFDKNLLKQWKLSPDNHFALGK